jgi:hypothetical protein
MSVQAPFPDFDLIDCFRSKADISSALTAGFNKRVNIPVSQRRSMCPLITGCWFLYSGALYSFYTISCYDDHLNIPL